MRNRIIYTGNFDLAGLNAAGQRVLANAFLLREIGYEVVFLGVGKAEATASVPDTRRDVCGFAAYTFPPGLRSGPRRYDARGYLRVFREFFAAMNGGGEVCLVIFYSSPSIADYDRLLIRHAHARGVNVVADAVDWLEATTPNIFFNLFKRADTWYKNAVVNVRSDGVLAISRFLRDYYRGRGVGDVLLLPPLSTETGVLPEARGERPVEIGYAGVPCRMNLRAKDPRYLKDRLDRAIALLCLAREQGAGFRFSVYGLTEREYLAAFPSDGEKLRSLGGSVAFHGWQPMSNVRAAISQLDYTILLRDAKRSTTAGFPMKVTESVGCGTPVIASDTSDILDYLERDREVFVIDPADGVALGQLMRALSLPAGQRLLNKQICLERNPFHYLRYREPALAFFGKLASPRA